MPILYSFVWTYKWILSQPFYSIIPFKGPHIHSNTKFLEHFLQADSCLQLKYIISPMYSKGFTKFAASS